MAYPIRKTPAMDQAIVNFWLVLLSDPLENRADIFRQPDGTIPPGFQAVIDERNEQAENARYLSRQEQIDFHDCFLTLLKMFPDGSIHQPTGKVRILEEDLRAAEISGEFDKMPVRVQEKITSLNDVSSDYGMPEAIKFVLEIIKAPNLQDFMIPWKSRTTAEALTGVVTGCLSGKTFVLHRENPEGQLEKVSQAFQETHGHALTPKARHAWMLRIRDHADDLHPACPYQKDWYTGETAAEAHPLLLKQIDTSFRKHLVSPESSCGKLLTHLAGHFKDVPPVATDQTKKHTDYALYDTKPISWDTPVYQNVMPQAVQLAHFLLDNAAKIQKSDDAAAEKWEVLSHFLGAAHYLLKNALPPRHLDALSDDLFCALQKKFAFKSPADFGLINPVNPTPSRGGGGAGFSFGNRIFQSAAYSRA